MAKKKAAAPVAADGPVIPDAIERWDTARLIPYARNARSHSPEQVAEIAGSIREFGWTNPVLADPTGDIIAGHGRVLAAHLLKMPAVPVIVLGHLSEIQKRALRLADNRIALNAGWDEELLRLELSELVELGGDTAGLGFSEAELAKLLGPAVASGPSGPGLRERFGLPPFSVFDARRGEWQDRKRLWIASGVESLEGRDENLMFSAFANPKTDPAGVKIRKVGPGTSVFDPVLCETLVNWFSPAGGLVLDPFAGGSVRGLVSGALGRRYLGVDLRPEQVEANRAQAAVQALPGSPLSAMGSGPPVDGSGDSMPALTPVERRGDVYLKRDDEFCIGGGRGGKVRTCWGLAQGAVGLVTAGSRSSPQVNIVAQIARRLGIPCRVHTPLGDLSPEVLMAQDAGAEVVQHKAGYNSVIIARARADALESGWREIPFGMECAEAVEATAAQVANLPADVMRIVMPVGSGMSLAGVLTGLVRFGRSDVKVVGVVVGADPAVRLRKYAPPGWEGMVELEKAGMEYNEAPPETVFRGVALDPIYEAKAVRFLRPGDLLWVVGCRASVAPAAAPSSLIVPEWRVGDSRTIDVICVGAEADFLLSCPPYADLEVYSEDPADLSTMEYDAFVAAYREIIAKSCALLKPDRFAAFVVGDIRDKKGRYRNFVGDTINAFLDAGLHLWNDAILINAVGSLALRCAKPFLQSRKLGHSHQNVLIFAKGDGFEAAAAAGALRPGSALCPFQASRQFEQGHENVLLFVKGSAKTAAAACGDPSQWVDPRQEPVDESPGGE